MRYGRRIAWMHPLWVSIYTPYLWHSGHAQNYVPSLPSSSLRVYGIRRIFSSISSFD